MSEPNHYLRAIYAEDEEDQFIAFREFLEAEMEACLDRMPDEPFSEMTDDQKSQWGYEKGKLDFCRTMHGLVVQAMLVRQMDVSVPTNGPDDDRE